MKTEDKIQSIDAIANSFVQKEKKSKKKIDKGKILLDTLEQMFFDAFGSEDGAQEERESLKSKIKSKKIEIHEKLFEDLDKYHFSEDTFSYFITTLQEYWSYKNLTPKERKLQEKLMEILELFGRQEISDKIIEKPEDIGKIFNKWVRKKNKDLLNKKPIECLKEIDPNFDIEDSNIKGVFM